MLRGSFTSDAADQEPRITTDGQLGLFGRYGPVSFGLVPHFLAAMPGSLVLFVLCLFGQAVGVVTALPGGGVSI